VVLSWGPPARRATPDSCRDSRRSASGCSAKPAPSSAIATSSSSGPGRRALQAAAYRGEVESAFRKYRPTIVVTFDIAKEAAVYHHPDHEAAGRTATAIAESVGGVTLYLFHTRAPDVAVDYSAVRDSKARAFAILGSYRD